MNGQLTAHFESTRTPATPDREIISIAERRASEIIWEAELRAEQIINQAKNSVRNEDANASPLPESRSHQEPRLSEGDVTLLREIASGRTADQAAHRLDLSARTLRRRLRNICDQLEVNTPIEAVTWAVRQKLI
ncbi:response regulator transcription factor [Actinomadura syzygii]|uniref:Response regulator transcription factor n=1 Tax=Actinomadura syzygii TaxID=1427538 RepID=A0A5D0ULJ8_9ACTN|nr:response regulator transcription factor [Actinomadura syzygii]